MCQLKLLPVSYIFLSYINKNIFYCDVDALLHLEKSNHSIKSSRYVIIIDDLLQVVERQTRNRS